MAAAVPAIAGSRIKMRRDGDLLEIAYLVGDLLAHGSLSTHPITIVPSMNYQSEQLDITVSATAMDRRGKASTLKRPRSRQQISVTELHPAEQTVA
jgi:hypothetical protein